MKKYVIQFKDSTFFEYGRFHGFVSSENGFTYGKVKETKDAWIFPFEWQGVVYANDLEIEEPYDVREIEVVYRLKNS